jgi:hypothetical protein
MDKETYKPDYEKNNRITDATIAEVQNRVKILEMFIAKSMDGINLITSGAVVVEDIVFTRTQVDSAFQPHKEEVLIDVVTRIRL